MVNKEISPTKINTWDTCNLKFWFNYIEHLYVPKSVHFVFGQEIHEMLKLMYHQNFKSSEKFVNFFNRRWREVVAGSEEFTKRYVPKKNRDQLEVITRTWISREKEEVEVLFGNHIKWYGDLIGSYFSYRRTAKNILTAFYEFHNNRNEHPLTERSLRTNFRGFSLMGKIDRVDLKPSGIAVVIDYKSSKKPPIQHYLQTSPQLTIYDLLVRYHDWSEDLGADFTVDDVLLYIYHLRTLEEKEIPIRERVKKALHSATRQDHHLDTLEAKCAEIEHGISDENFVPKYGFNCNYCDYQEPCLQYAVDSEGPKRVLIPLNELIDPLHANIFT